MYLADYLGLLVDIRTASWKTIRTPRKPADVVHHAVDTYVRSHAVLVAYKWHYATDSQWTPGYFTTNEEAMSWHAITRND